MITISRCHSLKLHILDSALCYKKHLVNIFGHYPIYCFILFRQIIDFFTGRSKSVDPGISETKSPKRTPRSPVPQANAKNAKYPRESSSLHGSVIARIMLRKPAEGRNFISQQRSITNRLITKTNLQLDAYSSSVVLC